MDRQEFIDQLRQSLNGRLDAEQVSDNVRYYEEYIDSQVRMGQSEADVMSRLGSPRLIARSITDAWMQGAPEEPASYAERETARGGQWDARDWGESGSAKHLNWLVKFFKMPRWLRYVVGFGVLFLILSILLSVLQFFAPVIGLFLIATLLVKLFRDWLK